MATYRNIASTETDPEAPVTSELMKALDENVDATAEQASGAPKIADKTILGSAVEITVSNLDDYAGIWLWGFSPDGLQLAYSVNNGGSFSTPVIVVSGGNNMILFFDFATGNYKSINDSNAASGGASNSGTIAGSSLNITDVRFSKVSAAAGSMNLFINPQGGESAS